MKKTLMLVAATLAISACTCTCPENQYETRIQGNYQPDYGYTFEQPVQFDTPSTVQYRRYTQISYIQPQQKQQEVMYYPVYQPVMNYQAPKYHHDCACTQTIPCGC